MRFGSKLGILINCARYLYFPLLLSYRPLSLTSCIGRILEKLLTNRIKKWAENNNILNLQQNGFRKNRNANDNLFKTIQLIRQNFNKSMISTIVFFDVEKAFEQV